MRAQPLKLILAAVAGILALEALFLGLYWAYFNRGVMGEVPEDAGQTPLPFDAGRRSRRRTQD